MKTLKQFLKTKTKIGIYKQAYVFVMNKDAYAKIPYGFLRKGFWSYSRNFVYRKSVGIRDPLLPESEWGREAIRFCYGALSKRSVFYEDNDANT